MMTNNDQTYYKCEKFELAASEEEQEEPATWCMRLGFTHLRKEGIRRYTYAGGGRLECDDVMTSKQGYYCPLRTIVVPM